MLRREAPPQLVDDTLKYLVRGYELGAQVIDELRLLALGIGGAAAFEHALALIANADVEPPRVRRHIETRDAFIARLITAKRDAAVRATAPLAVVDAPALGATVCRANREPN